MNTPTAPRKERFLGRLMNGVRPIPKKLARHKVISAIRIGVGAITFATMIFAGYYGFTAWMHQQSVVADANLRRVEAEVIHFNDPSKRWNQAAIDALAKTPLVEFGYPRKEVTVQLTVDGKRHQFASLEGVIGREPEFQESSLAWGRSVGRESRSEVLVSLPFFERLGGKLTSAGPKPAHLSLIVTRIQDGTTQTQRISMRIAGLLRRETDKTYAPLDLAINLDRWQTHKSESPLGQSRQSLESLITYDHVDAYVPERLRGQVPEEEATFAVRAEPRNEVEVLETPGEIWGRIVLKSAPSHSSRDDLSRLLGAVDYQWWPTWIVPIEGRSGVLVGLGEDDPRWQSVLGRTAPRLGEFLIPPQAPDLGNVLTNRDLSARRIHRSLPGFSKAVAFATRRTLQWSVFDVETAPDVAEQTHIAIPDRETALRLAKRYPKAISSPTSYYWAMIETEIAHREHGDNPVSKDHPNQSEGLPREPMGSVSRWDDASRPRSVSREKLEKFLDSLKRQLPNQEIGLLRQRMTDRKSGVMIRVVPDAFLSRVTKQPARRFSETDAIPCGLAGPEQQTERLRSSLLAGRRLQPLRTLSAEQAEIWLPATQADSLDIPTTVVGIVASGPWPDQEETWQAIQQGSGFLQASLLFRESPTSFWMDWKRPVAESLPILERDGVDARKLKVSRRLSLPLYLRQSGRRIVEQVVTAPDGEEPTLRDNEVALLGPTPGPLDPFRVGHQMFDNLVLRAEQAGQPGLARVSPRVFRRLAFEWADSQNRLPAPKQESLTLRFRDLNAFQQAERRLAAAGHRLETLVPFHRFRYHKYALRTLSPQGELQNVPAETANQLVMARPTFEYVVPRISLAAQVAETETHVVSFRSDTDPVWWESPLVAGSLPHKNEKALGLYLPQKLAEQAFPAWSPDEIVGREVRFRLSRRDGSRSPDIALLMKVSGITSSEHCLVPIETAIPWRLWQEGRLVYDSASHSFRTPAEVYDQRGFLSAVFYASSEEQVKPLIAHLKSRGCEVKHQLDEQDRLMRLAVALATLVVLFISGSVLNASANSSAVSWMDLSTKLKEIGVKMAYGVTRGDIAFAYLAEGLLVGLMACAVGTLTVVAVDSLLRDLIVQTMGLPSDFFLVTIYSPKIAWLYGLAGLVVVGFNALGTWIPTWLALRKSPIALMR